MAMGTLPPTSDLDEISRFRKQRITYLSLDGTKRKTQTVLTLKIFLREFSQALLSLRTISNQKAFQRWANEEEHETVFQKMDSPANGCHNSWVRLFLRETNKRCHDINARLDEPGMTVKESFATDFCLPENQSSPATRSVRRSRDCTPIPVRWPTRHEQLAPRFQGGGAGPEPLHYDGPQCGSNSNPIKGITKGKNSFMIAFA
jgi:hypothetical protein